MPEEDVDRETEFRADAIKSAGLLALLVESADEEADVFSQRRERHRAELLAGLFWTASVIVVDELFQDLHAMSEPGFDPAETFAVNGLPEQFMDRYDGRFLQQFIAAAVVVTTRVATSWASPATTAEALATVLLLGRVEVLVDTYEIDAGPGWREELEGALFEDEDHDTLYWEPDILATHPALLDGAVNLNFEDWFTPFLNPPGTAAFAVKDEHEIDVVGESAT